MTDWAQKQLEYSNIPAWHQAGITGKGIVVWDAENGKTTHGKQTAARVLHAAPDATVINASLAMNQDNTRVKSAEAVLDNGARYTVEDFIRQFGVKCITRSVAGTGAMKDVEAEFWRGLQERYNLLMFHSGGNSGAKGTRGDTSDTWIYVGTLSLNPKGVWVEPYSSEGQKIDFVDFRGEWSGTSFAAPFLCGKAALLVQKYGGHIERAFVYDYFKAHCEDLGDPGNVNKTGWGVPIMGKTETVIEMQIGNFKATVNGKPVLLDAAPKIENQRTLVPLRFVAEAFGAEVDWNPKTEEITIVR